MLPICKLTTAKSCKGQFVGGATFKKFTRRSATRKHVCELILAPILMKNVINVSKNLPKMTEIFGHTFCPVSDYFLMTFWEEKGLQKASENEYFCGQGKIMKKWG